MESKQTEILVHIAAPAMAADDAKYRALAAAYLAFEPTRRIPVTFDGGPSSGEEKDFYTEVVMVEQLPGEDAPPISSYIESPLLSFRSAVHNLDSPRPQNATDDQTQPSQSSWQAPPSVIQDSMPDNDLVLPQYCTPTRLLEHYASGERALSSSSPVSRSQQSPAAAAARRHRKRPSLDDWAEQDNGSQAGGIEEPADVIPLSPCPAKRRLSPPEPASLSGLDDQMVSSSQPRQEPAPVSSSRGESEPPLRKRPRTSRDPVPGKSITRSASDTGPQPRPATTSTDVSNLQPHPADDLLNILSPPPPTSQTDLDPSDLITPVLARLASTLNLEQRFRPAVQTRALRPFERGYWLLDCSTWEPELKRSAWRYLADYLGKGAAGWGVSCTRDGTGENAQRMRLYCWGCVVGHMYLLLYLASKRRVLYTGAKWVGAEGGEVVVMGVREGSGGGGKG